MPSSSPLSRNSDPLLDDLELMADALATPSARPSYIRYCVTCDHPEGDHAGRASWWGSRSGPCLRDGCACKNFIDPRQENAA